MIKKIAPILLVLFFDMLGFGIIIPVVRDLTEYLVINSGIQTDNYAIFAGVLMASYSLFQFIFAPLLGHLSDKYGRKPILVISIAGNIISYLMWATSQSFLYFLLSRIISGATGANISVAQSCIADLTKGESRAKYMGLVGAIFGIGFIFGPFIGGLASKIDINHLTGGGTFNPFAFIGVLSAGLSLINLIWLLLAVPETLPEKKQGPIKISHLYEVLNMINIEHRHPGVGRLVLIYFIMNLGFVHVESTLAWDLKHRFSLGTTETGYFFAFMGVVLAIVQGGIYRKLVDSMPLPQLIFIGLLVLSIGLLVMPLAANLMIASFIIIILAFGMGVSSPSLITYGTNISGEKEYGLIMGIMQGMASLARVIAPISATLLYDLVSKSSAYIAAGILVLLTVNQARKLK